MSEPEVQWSHKDEWKYQTRHFTVVVSRHCVSVPEWVGVGQDGGNRWCVYAYIYPTHWLFSRFDESESISQDAARELNMHGGASLVSYHQRADKVTSIQVGADYNHLGDNHYTFQSTKEDARSVFMDAADLISFLKQPEQKTTEAKQ